MTPQIGGKMISADRDVKKFLKQKRVCRWCGQEITSPGDAEYIETKRGQSFYIHTGCAYMISNVKRAKS